MFTTSSVQFSVPSSLLAELSALNAGSNKPAENTKPNPDDTVDLRALLEGLQALSSAPRATPKPPVSPFEVLISEVKHHLKRSQAEREALFTLHLQGYEVENAMIEALDYEADVLRRTIELLKRLHERTS